MIRDDSEKQIHGKQNRLMDIRTILGTIENSYLKKKNFITLVMENWWNVALNWKEESMGGNSMFVRITHNRNYLHKNKKDIFKLFREFGLALKVRGVIFVLN